MKLAAIVVVAALVASAYADVYMHNPPGGNNRVDDANNAPANRLFDSQNNNQAGYNSGEESDNTGYMKYYETSELSISWTSQHGCGTNPQTHCDIIVQYRCDTLMRNGISRERPEDDLATADTEPGADRGRHEPYSNWLDCKTRDRNQGLFVADQNVGNQARSTRQNAGGGRSGYECAEERDYYPYWHPSVWKDVAIMTDNTTRCEYYQRESQNVMAKGTCSTVTDNNPVSCAQNGGTWIETPAFGIDAPDCVLAPWGRANLHGNAVQQTADGVQVMEHAMYNWTIPGEVSSSCVVRLRYNISTDDYNGWETDARLNAGATPIENDPNIDIGVNQELQLNINTAQFGRTFEDRSHIFEIMARPSEVPSGSKIYNMNVRGKRGNNAATYPSTEYDFFPHRVHMKVDDAVHWQWTGSENNNNGNDRSNAVQIEEYGVSYPMMATDVTLFGDDQAILKSAATSCGSEDANLQDVAPYCDVGIVVMENAGTYHFMSTKNNAYSNRSQKGTIIVEDAAVSGATTIIFIIGGVAVLGAGGAAALVWKKKRSSAGGRF